MCRAVNEAFIRLHDSGKIVRKKSLVNWSCHLQTAISDIEVDHRTVDGPTLIRVPGYDEPVRFGLLYQFAYKLADDKDQEIIVSTTRPETMIGDTAIAVHPEDTRYSQYIGRFVQHPIRMEKIPIIADASVDPQFGTGALKITPAHDPNDYRTAECHQLPMINIFDNQGKANENCGTLAVIRHFRLSADR
jgi:valyl-tRNA synthetase